MSYPIYDTAQFGTVAGATHELFQNAQGQGGTTLSTTNMRGAGQFNGNEKFTIRKIGLIVDDVITLPDVRAMYYGSILSVRIAQTLKLQVPLQILADKSAYGGHYTEVAASDSEFIGLVGNGYELDIPLIVMGNDNFLVSIFQALALSAVTLAMKCVLYGDLEVK